MHIMSPIMFLDIYAGNNSTALFAVEMKSREGRGREREVGEVEKK